MIKCIVSFYNTNDIEVGYPDAYVWNGWICRDMLTRRGGVAEGTEGLFCGCRRGGRGDSLAALRIAGMGETRLWRTVFMAGA